MKAELMQCLRTADWRAGWFMSLHFVPCMNMKFNM